MKIKVDTKGQLFNAAELKVIGVYQKDNAKSAPTPVIGNKEAKEVFDSLKSSKAFNATSGDQFLLNDLAGDSYLLVGLGTKKNITSEKLRRMAAKVMKSQLSLSSSLSIDLESFFSGSFEKNANAMIEGIFLSDYSFNKYMSKTKKNTLQEVSLKVSSKNSNKLNKIIKDAQAIAESMNIAKDFATEAPNYLNSVKYAQLVSDDVKKNLKGYGIKVKVLGKAELQKEKMGLFLSVNAGSAYGPRLVHLTYTPKKQTRNMKHIALVGKGITFDTGGYSLKPSGSMMGMKYDMAGSSTVYGAFRAAVLQGSKHKITCVLGMTDNAVNDKATMPDSIVTARNGKTVEILNTDAEGRLVLADCLDYTSDLKPDIMFNAATLTGACLVALGDEVCGLISNTASLVKDIKKAADQRDEYIWELPIIEEFRSHIKSKVADIKNIGKPMRAGTITAGAFLEEFVGENIKWAHFDIAGVANNQDHLSYCSPGAASGLMIRTMTQFIHNA